MLKKITNNMFEASVLFLSSIFLVLYLKKDKRSPPNEKRNDPDADYRKEKGLFDTLFLNNEGTTTTTTNINIPDMEDLSSEDAETKWKSRILFHHTVQGNIIMYYDVYKLAFVYYSDMQISYKWLNYCAMKYVRIFYCRDFFLDDSFLPANIQNPFNEKKSKEEKDDLQKKEDKKKGMEIDFESDVFLKRRETPKNRKTTDLTLHSSKGKEKEQEKEKEKEKEKRVNNFRYMGKLANFSFLQIPAKEERKITKNCQYSEFKRKLKEKQDQH